MSARADVVLERLAQELRVAHCANGGKHPCVGTCTITPSGVELACRVCGDGKEPIAPAEHLDEVLVAKAALAGVGLEWGALTPEAQRTIYSLVKGTDLVRRRGMP